jgi:hypothetical protein
MQNPLPVRRDRINLHRIEQCVKFHALPTAQTSLIWRRKSESNRRPRLCRPLHNHSAIPPIEIKTGKAHAFPVLQTWSGKRVSNSRPQPWQGCALPTELFPRFKEGAILRIFGRVSTTEMRTIFRAFAAMRPSDSKPLTAMSKMRRHKSLRCL